MKENFPLEWLRAFLDSGLVRAAARGGGTRGDGRRGRSGGHGALMVYLAILTYPDGSPSMAELERVTGIGSPNTLRKYIETLEALGAIKVGRYRDGNRYEVLPLPDLSLPAPSASQRVSSERGSRDERKTYRGPDGHVLHSDVELAVDILLTCYGVPHAREVPYSAIFEGFEGKHDIDFLLTPKVGIEVWGAAGPDYRDRRKMKEDVAKEHGFVLHGVGTLEEAYVLVPRLRAELGSTFGDLDAGGLRRLLGLFRRSPSHRDTLPGFVALTKRIEVVEAEAAKMLVMDPRERDADWFPDPRLVNRRTEDLGFRITSPELRDAEDRVQVAARMARSAATQLEQERIITGAGDPQQEWAGRMLFGVRQARASLADADGALGAATAILERRMESPAQAEQRRAQQAEVEAHDRRVHTALRLLGRVEAALEGRDNPYAEGDARRAREARRAALRAALLEVMPELAGAADEDHVEGAVSSIEDEIDPEKLADIL